MAHVIILEAFTYYIQHVISLIHLRTPLTLGCGPRQTLNAYPTTKLHTPTCIIAHPTNQLHAYTSITMHLSRRKRYEWTMRYEWYHDAMALAAVEVVPNLCGDDVDTELFIVVPIASQRAINYKLIG